MGMHIELKVIYHVTPYKDNTNDIIFSTVQAEDEYEKIFLNGLIVPEKEEEDYPPALTAPDPTVDVSLDWSKRGLVSSVKSQVILHV